MHCKALICPNCACKNNLFLHAVALKKCKKCKKILKTNALDILAEASALSTVTFVFLFAFSIAYEICIAISLAVWAMWAGMMLCRRVHIDGTKPQSNITTALVKGSDAC
jgi:hypothetical protein